MRPYIDCHNHIGKTLNRIPPTGQNTAMCLARFAQTNMHAALSMPTATGGLMIRGLEDRRAQNALISRNAVQFPDVFPIGLALVDPCLGDLALDEAERALTLPHLVGVVSHPPVREAALPFVEMVAARKGLCNLHLHDALFGEILAQCPDATFITHASAYATEHFARRDNVWFEVVQYPDGRNTRYDFEALVNQVGSERIVFGADLPYFDYRFLQREIEEAPISEDVKDRLAHRNMETLIRQYRPEWSMPATPPQAPRHYAEAELWACDEKQPDRLTVMG